MQQGVRVNEIYGVREEIHFLVPFLFLRALLKSINLMLFLSWIEKKIRNLQPSICSSGSTQRYGRSLSAYTLPILSFHNATDKINISCGNHLCEVDNVACQEKFAFISFRYILSSNDCLGEFCRKCRVTGG